MTNSKSMQFRIGNEYETDDLEEDQFWDMQSKSIASYNNYKD